MSNSVKGKKTLVTVARQGIGAATARLLVAEGAQILLTDKNAEAAHACAAQIFSEFGKGPALSTRPDVTCKQDWIAALRLAEDEMGGLSVRTAILQEHVGEKDEATVIAKLERQVPVGRLGEAEEVARLVLYLATDESRFVTASELKIDGGISAM